MTGIEPALSAWELDGHASADQHVAGQPPSPVVPEYPLRTDRTPSIGHAAGTLPGAAPWRMQASSWHSVMIAPLNGSWGCIIFVILFILVAGFFASVLLIMHRKAVRDSRRVGAPDARRTATFRGGMWWPGRYNAGPGTMSLDFFDWGIRLGGGDLTRFLSPVWEARYGELTEARLVKAPTHQGIRFHTSDDEGEDEVFFWTGGVLRFSIALKSTW